MHSGESDVTRSGTENETAIAGLPPDTSRVFKILANVADLSCFVLVGGTAMALQCRHRLSEDLDFWLPEGRLREREIRPAIHALRQAGYEVVLTYPGAGEISAFKIQRGLFEGISLEDRMREYSANGVKIQFFAPEDHERDVFGPYASTATRHVEGMPFPSTFAIMPLEGIFVMKAYAIQRRYRARDLLDLWHFVRAGRTIAEIVIEAQRVTTTATVERAFSVLRGDLPLDQSDEGFHSLAPGITLDRIHTDFRAWTDRYEQERIRTIAAAALKSG